MVRHRLLAMGCAVLVSCSPAWARWVRFAGGPHGRTYFFDDTTLVRPALDRAEVWLKKVTVKTPTLTVLPRTERYKMRLFRDQSYEERLDSGEWTPRAPIETGTITRILYDRVFQKAPSSRSH